MENGNKKAPFGISAFVHAIFLTLNNKQSFVICHRNVCCEGPMRIIFCRKCFMIISKQMKTATFITEIVNNCSE